MTPAAHNGAAVHSAPMEASILGGVILRNDVLKRLDELEVEDFFDPRHKVVFQAMRNLEAAARPIDVLTLEHAIAAAGKLDAIGGPGFLGDLALQVPTVDNVLVYADTVRRDRRRRDLRVRLRDLQTTLDRGALEPDEELSESIGELQRLLPSSSIAESRYGRPFVEYVGADEPDDNPADVFDAHGLIVRGEPSLVIGDPKVGKTLLLTDLVLHMAAGRREWCGLRIYRRPRVLLFLREDSARTTVRRLWQLARGAGIEHWELADHLVIDSTSALYFDDDKLTAKLERQLAHFDICAIDSLSTIHNADENSVERMAPIMNRWRDLSLGTSTAIPLVHHFRKRGVDTPASGGNVLQRARGSSIIAATTRHAVGVEVGPDDHQLAVAIESNHEVDLAPFVIRRRFGEDDTGRKYIRHERVGTLMDAREQRASELIDPITLAIVRAAGPEGVGPRALRTAVTERLREQRGKGVRPVKVDESAARLERAGQIARSCDRWRAS